MDDFSLSDAIVDDVPGQAPKSNTNPAAPANPAPPPTNPGWPGAAPGAPGLPPSSSPAQLPGPGAPGQYPGGPACPGQFPSGPGAPGQYPGAPSGSGGFPSPPGFPGQYPPGPGAPGHFPGGPGAPGQFPSAPGQYPSGGGAPLPFPSGVPGQFPSGPGAPPGPYPDLPYPGGQPPVGPYGHGAPGAFPPTSNSGAFPPNSNSGNFPGFPGGAYPPIPPGTWGPPGSGAFPTQPGHPGSFGMNPMGPYQNPSFGGPFAPGGMLPVPYDFPLHSGMMPGLLITIVGEPTPGADRFEVDFIKGPDVVFHLNPRFNEQTIVCNSSLGGCWGPEEREGGFPFVPGRRFELKILVEEDVYKVALDETHLLEYEHRVGGLAEVNLLRVLGDVILYSVAPSMI